MLGGLLRRETISKKSWAGWQAPFVERGFQSQSIGSTTNASAIETPDNVVTANPEEVRKVEWLARAESLLLDKD